MYKPQVSPPPSEDLSKPFGWDVTVTYLKNYVQTVTETYHYRNCTEAKARWKARRKALFKPLSSNVVVVKAEPLSEVVWLRAYGDGRM